MSVVQLEGDELTVPQSPTRRSSAMLALPQRGDVIARRWAVIGFAVYLLMAVVFIATLVRGANHSPGETLLELVGLGHPTNFALFVLVVGGLLLSWYAFWLVRGDIADLAKEEDDIDWVEKHPTVETGLLKVFVPANERARIGSGAKAPISLEMIVSGAVETLMDDCVRRVLVARESADGGNFSPDEMRVRAEKRTARYGSFARYVSSLLLLLAVLGTFAGVKTAMPGLIQAVSASGQSASQVGSATGSPGSSTDETAEALRAVAGAFGGNALALIGAIVLGLMAQGIAFGRRDLLQRLELVASEHLYRDVRTRSANPLESAVQALDRTAREFKDSNGALLGLESQMQLLGEQLRTSFAALEGRLADLVNRHEADLYDRTSETLEAVHKKMGDLTDAVAASARTYLGISEALALRAEESRRAISEMRESNVTLTRALNDVIALGSTARTAAEEYQRSTAALRAGSTELKDRVDLLVSAVQQVQPVTGDLRNSIDAAVERLSASERESIDAWKTASEALINRLAELSSAQRLARAEPAALAGNDMQGLRELLQGFTRDRISAPLLIALPALGILIAGLILWALVRFELM